jgi:hypothetical protein
MANRKLEELLELPDVESRAEFEKLSFEEKEEFKKMLKADARKYQELTLSAQARIKKLETELSNANSRYEYLKSLN